MPGAGSAEFGVVGIEDSEMTEGSGAPLALTNFLDWVPGPYGLG